jgi:hypothetical protein
MRPNTLIMLFIILNLLYTNCSAQVSSQKAPDACDQLYKSVIDSLSKDPPDCDGALANYKKLSQSCLKTVSSKQLCDVVNGFSKCESGKELTCKDIKGKDKSYSCPECRQSTTAIITNDYPIPNDTTQKKNLYPNSSVVPE